MTPARNRADANERSRRLSILLAAGPDHPGFQHGVRLAQAAVGQGIRVHLYCIDEGVWGLGSADVDDLRSNGVQVYGCAYAAERRGLPWERDIVYGGLALLSDLMAGCDRFVAFG
jgi:sulfur relay (sulfurtransferase) complex TusBCD TusD component (DsrE family)